MPHACAERRVTKTATDSCRRWTRAPCPAFATASWTRRSSSSLGRARTCLLEEYPLFFVFFCKSYFWGCTSVVSPQHTPVHDPPTPQPAGGQAGRRTSPHFMAHPGADEFWFFLESTSSPGSGSRRSATLAVEPRSQQKNLSRTQTFLALPPGLELSLNEFSLNRNLTGNVGRAPTSWMGGLDTTRVTSFKEEPRFVGPPAVKMKLPSIKQPSVKEKLSSPRSRLLSLPFKENLLCVEEKPADEKKLFFRQTCFPCHAFTAR